MAQRQSLAARHFCSACHARVYPYDSFEALTMAPDPGASGQRVLLVSFNQHLALEGALERVAWCWACDGWTTTYRVTRADLALFYARRSGVRFRGNGRSEAALIREIEQRVEARGGINRQRVRSRAGGAGPHGAAAGA